MVENIIDIQSVTKSYELGKPALSNLSLTISKGSFVTIIGPSGCGKTTLLRLINGMEEAESGHINVLGKDLADWDKTLLRRNIGYVIQRGGLFPHLTIKQNIGFVLSISENDAESIDKRVNSLADRKSVV